MKHHFLHLAAFACAAMVSPSTFAQTTRVLSPDGLTYLDVKLADGSLSYSAGYRQVVKAKKKGAKADTLDVPMLLDSPLGVYTNVADFSKNLTLVETVRPEGSIKHNYFLRQGKQSQINSEENSLGLVLTTPQRRNGGVQMTVQFSVFNNNIAYRYRFLQGGETGAIVVTGEASGFRLPTDATAFICPQSDPMIGWKRTKPSYEEGYIWDEPITTRSNYGHGWTFPCLFHEGDKGWLLISETGVSSGYCGSHLSDASPDGLFTIAFPMEGENNGFGSTGAQLGLGNCKTNANDDVTGFTPWRTITFGSSLKPIVETTVIWDVVEPLYEPSIDYKGSRNTWSWILWQDPNINYDDQVKFIDLASKMGFEYCLVDGCWDVNIGRERIAELSRYAQSKGVSLLLWYNSNGYENDAPQTPRDCMNTGMARDKEMAWMKSIGVKGIKVDFFGGDKQVTMQLYEDILYDANRYGLQCIFHGCTLPRGWERMYPNYISSEAVLASENVYFTERHAKAEPFELTMHPFCRNAVGTMDWGGIIMNHYLSKDNKSRHQRFTTDIFEMATGIINQAAIQCVAMQPNNLDELLQFELDWLRAMPTTWDETRFIDGYPGRYVVLARRHGNDWYVAGLNALSEPLSLTLDLPMFAAGSTLKLYIDDKKTGESTLTSVKTNKRQQVKVVLQPAGGVIIQK